MSLFPTLITPQILDAIHKSQALRPEAAPTRGNFNVPDPPPSAPPDLSGPINTIIGWGKYGVLVCGVAGLLICGGQMAIGRKNRSSFAADGATGVPWVLGGLSLVATAASIVKMFVG